jgi:predicted permease
MEIARASGAGVLAGLRQVGRGLATNALVIGIVLGVAVNLAGTGLPAVVWEALELIARAGLPTALFGLGGVLFRYRPEGDLRLIAWSCGVSLVAHPAIVWGLGSWWGLGTGAFRSAVITAAMAPGVNAYLFANMYGRAKRVAASTVLIGTGVCALSAWMWMSLLP